MGMIIGILDGYGIVYLPWEKYEQYRADPETFEIFRMKDGSILVLERGQLPLLKYLNLNYRQKLRH